MTTLYRAVSHEEFEQIMRTGTFQAGANSAIYGKYFAESAENAAQWGQRLEGTKGFRIVDARIPTVEAAKFMRWERIDNIGPMRYATFEQLRSATVGVVK